DTARAVEREVRAALPGAHVEFDPGNGLLAIGTSSKMRDLLFAIIPHGAHVNLQLADGVDLPNPKGLIEGTGKRIRHVKVRSPEGAASADVRAIVRAQVGHRSR
ncbi:MAG TPA: hypothetical protein VH723_05140, partial [Candidatus Limnocylindrales bacterium]